MVIIIRALCFKGKGAWMAKINIGSAFRNIPVHPADQHLLAMQWKDAIHVTVHAKIVKTAVLNVLLNICYSNHSQCRHSYFGLLCAINPILLNRSYRKYAFLFSIIWSGEYHYRSTRFDLTEIAQSI